MALDKEQKYALEWDPVSNVWRCTSENFQFAGVCGERGLNDPGLASLLAVADAAGYDTGIIADDLECYHTQEVQNWF